MSAPMLSSGVLAYDRALGAHKARLECIAAAIEALGRLRSEYGMELDAYPADLLEARAALWRAYYAEEARRPTFWRRPAFTLDEGTP